MKIARCTEGGAPFWALVDTDTQTLQPIAGAFADWGPALTRAIAAGKAEEGRAALPLAGEARPLDSVRLLPPIEPINRVVVAGANYAKHLADDFGLKAPPQPIAFLKAYGALIGAHDPIRYPPLTQELDHEVELGAVHHFGPVRACIDVAMHATLVATVPKIDLQGGQSTPAQGRKSSDF